MDLDRTEAALIWLRAVPQISGKIGLYGASRGAEHALVVTSLMAAESSAGTPDAVAVHSPSDTVADAFVSKGFDPQDHEVWDPSRRPWRWRGSSETLRPTTPIEIERFEGPLFLSHGAEDQVWTADCTRRLERRLRADGRTPEVHIYADEGHALSAAAERGHHGQLIDFFRRALRV